MSLSVSHNSHNKLWHFESRISCCRGHWLVVLRSKCFRFGCYFFRGGFLLALVFYCFRWAFDFDIHLDCIRCNHIDHYWWLFFFVCLLSINNDNATKETFAFLWHRQRLNYITCNAKSAFGMCSDIF